MTDSVLDYIRTGGGSHADPEFPHAPSDWSRDQAEAVAHREGLILGADHWQAIRALQSLFARQAEDVPLRARDVHDALEEQFHARGGIKYVYELFPGGPIAQGCRMAGLTPPPGAADPGFGSVI